MSDQSKIEDTPFLFKQWGEYAPSTEYRDGRRFMAHSGKKAAGRLLDGLAYDEYPRV